VVDWKATPASPDCQSPRPRQQTTLAFSLIYDYTLGFALSDRTTVNEQRVQDTATRHQLHAFFRSLPADRFPALAVGYGTQAARLAGQTGTAANRASPR
jgi:hypothetical protein